MEAGDKFFVKSYSLYAFLECEIEYFKGVVCEAGHCKEVAIACHLVVEE